MSSSRPDHGLPAGSAYRSAEALWLLAFVASAGLLAGALLPLALPPAAEAVRGAFRLVCHQLPERSPGGVAGLCYRCTGLLAGVALGLLAARRIRLRLRGRASRLAWLLVALTPLTADWLSGALGVWDNSALSRLATGGFFGAAAGVLLGEALLPPAVRSGPPGARPATRLSHAA